MLRTIETDPSSMLTRRRATTPPFGAPDVPAGEWVYLRFLGDWARGGRADIAAQLEVAADRATHTYGRPITFTDLPRFPTSPSRERVVVAYVNHGRWVWDCPCGCAQVCSATDPRAFCVGCFNGGDGYWPVVWPDLCDQIAELLGRRPHEEQRNWKGEPLDQLQLENLAAGVDPDLPQLTWPGAADALRLVRAALPAVDAQEALPC